MRDWYGGGRIAGLPAPVRGALWTCCAVTLFACMINLVRFLSETQHTLEIVLFRNLFGLMALLPWLLRNGLRAMRTSRPGLHMIRAALGLLSMILWFWTLDLLPTAEATALSFLAPVLVSILAVPLLKEHMHPDRLLAVIVAFAGVLLIVDPGSDIAWFGASVALVTAFAWALSAITVKLLSRTESSALIAAYMLLPITPISLVLAIPVWQPPTTTEFLAFMALGAVGTAGHVCMARAMATTEAGIVAAFDYLRLPAVAIIAYLAFGDIANAATWVGGTVIAMSGLYVAHREARRQSAGLHAPKDRV